MPAADAVAAATQAPTRSRRNPVRLTWSWATLRSAGLEVVAAWQYGEQIQDPKLRAGMMSLLRQRCMFSMGESKDAREMSDIAMTVYTDLIKDDAVSRSRVRLTPDVIFNLPNHRALCSWIASGARSYAFLAETIPLAVDEQVVNRHTEVQRARGAFVPDRLPNPLPAFGDEAIDEPATPELVGAAVDGAPPLAGSEPPREGRPSPIDEEAVATFDPTSAADDGRPSRRIAAAERAAAAREAPETYTELDLDTRGHEAVRTAAAGGPARRRAVRRCAPRRAHDWCGGVARRACQGCRGACRRAPAHRAAAGYPVEAEHAPAAPGGSRCGDAARADHLADRCPERRRPGRLGAGTP